jgi:gentisate 1,2-dioxygenase
MQGNATASAPMRLNATSLDDLYEALEPLSFGAGWNKPTPSLYPAPHKTFVPARWRYADGRAALESAGRLIDTSLAERRNLILINPLEGNIYGTGATLVAAYQMLLPGEHARSHRHTPNALRLIMESDAGAYTTVDGVRVPMLPNDVVLTPSWMWHGHGNEGAIPAYWIDYLDVPLVQTIEPMFLEMFPGGIQAAERVDERSPLRFAWTDIEPQLRAAAVDPSGRFGRKLVLDTPSLRTIRLAMLALSGGSTASYQTTATNIYSVVSGTGTTTVDGVALDWQRGDVFVAPAWRPHVHHADGDAVLFCVNDEPLLEAIGMLREVDS